MAQKNETSSEQLITLEVASRLLMITAERIRQLSKAGYIAIPKRGHTTIVSAVQGYIRFLKDEDRKNTKSSAAQEAVKARADEINLRIAEKRRDLIPIEDHRLAMDLVAGAINRAFTGLPARVTRDVALRRQIEAIVYECRAEVAAAIAAGNDLAATGRDASDPDATDDAGPMGAREPGLS